MTAAEPPPKLARRPTAPSLLALIFPILRAPLPRAPQRDRDRRGRRETRIPLAFRGSCSPRKRERLCRIAPRDQAARRWAFVRVLKCPRDAPPFSFSFYLSTTCPLLGGRALGT